MPGDRWFMLIRSEAVEIRYLFPILFDDYLFTSIWEREKDSTQEHGLFNELFISIGSTTLFNIEGKKRDSHLWEKHFLRLSLWRYDQWRDGYIQCLFRRATGKENNCFYLGESLRYIMDRSSLAILSLAKWKPSWTSFDRRERERENEIGENLSLIFLSSSFNHPRWYVLAFFNPPPPLITTCWEMEEVVFSRVETRRLFRSNIFPRHNDKPRTPVRFLARHFSGNKE